MIRICVVDDDEVTRRTVGRLLAFEGYDVAIYEDAQPCLDGEGRFENVDLILTDSSMPTPATVLLTAVRAMGLEVPVIVMSGNFREGDREQYRELGAAKLIEKPIGLDLLSGAISEVLGL